MADKFYVLVLGDRPAPRRRIDLTPPPPPLPPEQAVAGPCTDCRMSAKVVFDANNEPQLVTSGLQEWYFNEFANEGAAKDWMRVWHDWLHDKNVYAFDESKFGLQPAPSPAPTP